MPSLTHAQWLLVLAGVLGLVVLAVWDGGADDKDGGR